MLSGCSETQQAVDSHCITVVAGAENGSWGIQRKERGEENWGTLVGALNLHVRHLIITAFSFHHGLYGILLEHSGFL